MTTTSDVRLRSSRILCLPLVAAPILLLAGTALVPAAANERHGTDRALTQQVLQQAAPDRGHLPVTVVLLTLGLGFLVPAAVGLARLAGQRMTAVIGAGLVAIGAPAGVAVNAVSDLILYRFTDPALSPASAVDGLAYDIGPAAGLLFGLYLLVLPGLVLLAVAAWRARALNWWQALLIGLGVMLGFAGPEGVAGAAFSLPLVAGTIIAATKLCHLGSVPTDNRDPALAHAA